MRIANGPSRKRAFYGCLSDLPAVKVAVLAILVARVSCMTRDQVRKTISQADSEVKLKRFSHP